MEPTIFINTVLLQVCCERAYTTGKEEDLPVQLEVLLLCVYWRCVVTSFEPEIGCPSDPSTVVHQENWRYLLWKQGRFSQDRPISSYPAETSCDSRSRLGRDAHFPPKWKDLI